MAYCSFIKSPVHEKYGVFWHVLVHEMEDAMVRLTINTQIKEYPEDITWQKVAQEYQKEYSDEILLVQVNGKLQELQEKIREGEVQFVTARQKPGISAYQRSATLLMLKAGICRSGDPYFKTQYFHR